MILYCFEFVPESDMNSRKHAISNQTSTSLTKDTCIQQKLHLTLNITDYYDKGKRISKQINVSDIYNDFNHYYILCFHKTCSTFH